ncbi:MAG: prepilin-type N-terminal cleavage/methylation domain-containing protein [Gemmatimonadales bacterium]
MVNHTSAPRSGFSLVEVIIAMLLLSVGVLAMGTSTGFILTQVRAAELRTERAVTVREAAERLRAVPWAQLDTDCETLPVFVSNEFSVECVYLGQRQNLRDLGLVSTGPGHDGQRLVPQVVDTLRITRSRPL